MFSSNPLTASVDIQRAYTPSRSSIEVTNTTENKKNLGEFADDVLNISILGLEKQRKEAQLLANNEINDIANDVIRVSSSIGRARTLGNLTDSQATNLYNKIAALL